MNHFDSVAECYDKVLPAHVEEHYFRKRMRFLSGLLGSGRILDVCSGTGRISEGLIKRGFDVVSLDSSENMLSMRNGINGYQPVKGLSYDLPFDNEVFDLAVCVAALHHVAEKEKVRQTIEEMKRVVKKGGYIVLWDHNPLNPYWRIIMKRVPQDTGEERLIPQTEMTGPFESGGYRWAIYKKGFIPDFAPKWLMGFFRLIEKCVEAMPGLNLLAAHNVVVARKE
ncbi:MAG: methyltransferase domain-containing protein [Nitrospirae bacterium]|nr:methyltransferase domain-containing protein [Nitrospirota bacterium]